MKTTFSPLRMILSSTVFALVLSLPLAAQNVPSSSAGAATKLETASTPALTKVRALPTQEYATDDGNVAYKIATDNVSGIAPELVQTRIETLPSPHPRMPHMTQQKRVATVDYAAVVPLLVKAMQEQQAEIERLRNELSAMKAQAQK